MVLANCFELQSLPGLGDIIQFMDKFRSPLTKNFESEYLPIKLLNFIIDNCFNAIYVKFAVITTDLRHYHSLRTEY